MNCLGMKITQTCCDELSEPANMTRDRIIYPCGSLHVFNVLAAILEEDETICSLQRTAQPKKM